MLVLEKEPRRRAEDFLPYDELYNLEHKALTPTAKIAPNIYVDPAGKAKRGDRWWIGSMVGGATMLWEVNLPRYTEEDFAARKYFRDNPPGPRPW